jgi:hypothetical protein
VADRKELQSIDDDDDDDVDEVVDEDWSINFPRSSKASQWVFGGNNGAEK